MNRQKRLSVALDNDRYQRGPQLIFATSSAITSAALVRRTYPLGFSGLNDDMALTHGAGSSRNGSISDASA